MKAFLKISSKNSIIYFVLLTFGLKNWPSILFIKFILKWQAPGEDDDDDDNDDNDNNDNNKGEIVEI